MQQLRRVTLPILVAVTACGLVGWTALRPLVHSSDRGRAAKLDVQISTELEPVVGSVNRLFEERWSDAGLDPAERADELQVLRRLSLALVGTIPSLEEIRQFESDAAPDRLRRWTLRLLADRRFAEHFAERLAVVFVGDRAQYLPWFSQSRFESWLADQLMAGRPYDEMVRQMISETGPPTSNAAANFVTAEIVQGEQYASRLAARTARAFLGQRIDCAECHDHPFDDWTQADFRGLAAYFAQVRTKSVSVDDDRGRQHEIEERETLAKRVIEPRVPFHDEWLGDAGTRRRQLADWITHRENRRFLRAISNRVWGLMFGRPYVTPVDAIPNPQEPGGADADLLDQADETKLLDILAADLREHGSDLRRLALVIASSRPFRLASTHPSLQTLGDPLTAELARCWVSFPLAQIRPEQLARSLQQATSIRPLRPDENIFTQTHRWKWTHQFIEQYGSLGENELDPHSDSIPQTIHRMQSRFTRDSTRAGWSSAAGRIAAMAPDDAVCLETCYLVCLTRRPTEAERKHFLTQLRDARSRNRPRVVEDIFWTLFNSPEFAWNH